MPSLYPFFSTLLFVALFSFCEEEKKRIAFHCAHVVGIEYASNVNVARCFICCVIVIRLEFKKHQQNLPRQLFHFFYYHAESFIPINFRAELFNYVSHFFLHLFRWLVDHFINQTK